MLRVLVGSTGPIVSYPRLSTDRDVTTGVPTSATARRVSPVSPDAAGVYVPAVVDTLSSTTVGVSTEGSDSITLSSSASIVAGRRYLITDAITGHRFVVVASRTTTSTTLRLAEPLTSDVASGSSVSGIAVSVDLTSAQTDTPGAGYVLFRATVDGVVREWDESFRVVRRLTSIALTPTDLIRAYPIVRQIASSTDYTLDEAIEASWSMLIVPALSARGVLDEDIITDDVIMPMHAAATAYHLARQWPAAPSDFVGRLRDAYEQARQTTWDRIDLAVRAQDETPAHQTPGGDGPRYMRITR